MEHAVFVLLNFGILLSLLIADRGRAREYVLLGAFGLMCAFIFETVTTALGFWHHVSVPQIPLVSLYTWLLYAPYLSFSYFVGNALVKHGR